MSPASDRTRIVSEEAAYWYIRCIDERRMSRADRRLFLAWLKRSPENIAEILRIAEMDGRFAGKWLRDRVGELEGSNVIDIGLAERFHRDYQPSKSVSDKVPGRGWPMWGKAVAAMVLATVLAFSVVLVNRVPEGVVQTAASQWQSMKLDDGSVAYLDARTRLRVEFTEQRRTIHLDRGWVVFDVAKDRNRPFTVRTGTVDVTAVGTRFGVDVDQGVTTTVEEGTVKVTPRGNDDGPAVFLHPGQELFVRHGGLLTFSKPVISEGDIVEVDAERKLMWASGRVQLIDTSIGEIVRQFNRRHEIQAKIDDPAIADLSVDLAIMHVDSVSDFIEVMESRGVSVTRSGSTLVLRVRQE
jgi:transmembrane sensor